VPHSSRSAASRSPPVRVTSRPAIVSTLPRKRAIEAMFGGHLTLGDDVHISGGTAVTSDILKAGRYTGVFPVAEHSAWQHNAAVIGQLAQLRRRVRATERQGPSDAADEPANNKQDK